MARSRNIKPGFFSNEYLAELEPLARILFIGLWCYADREGRLEDRPKRIKSDILPYDSCNINKLLNSLASSPEKFITRYIVDSKQYIQINNFLKHQNPHIHEVTSVIPAYDSTVHTLYKYGTSMVYGTSTIQAPDKHKSCRADSFNPHTDSLIPHTDTSDMVLNDFFEKLWELYPRKEGKGQVSISKKKELYKIGYDEIVRAIERYKDATTNTEARFIKMGSTFFNSGYVDYLDANYEEPKGYGYMLPGGGAML